MPRKYVPKSKPKYSPEDLKQALKMVKNRDLSVLEATRRFNIPQATIYSRISGARSDNPRGRKTILTKDEEMFLVHAIKVFQQWQQPISTATVRQVAKAYMLELGKNIPAKTTLRDWFSGFMARWSNELKVSKTMKLEKVRSKGCTKDVAGELTTLMLKKIIVLFQTNGLNIWIRWWLNWNCSIDQKRSGMWTSLASVMIQEDDKWWSNVLRNMRSLHTVGVGRITRQWSCVLLQPESNSFFSSVRNSVNVFRRCLPPYIIYQAARLYDAWCPRNGFRGTRYNVTDSGWVDEKVFYDWLTVHFIPSVKMIKRPIMLIFDGHSAYISTRIIRAALDNQIELECLPPHTTTILQPLDVATLTKVKTAWRQLLNDHNLKTNAAPIDKSRFALLVSDCPLFDPLLPPLLFRSEIFGEITWRNLIAKAVSPKQEYIHSIPKLFREKNC